MNNELSNRTALITGASRGLGLALARALAEEGWTLIIDARGANASRSNPNRTRLAARLDKLAQPKTRW